MYRPSRLGRRFGFGTYPARVDGLPIIDIAPLPGPTGDAEAVGRQIDTACRDLGFFYITGHGIDQGLQARLESLAGQLFDLPEDEKAEIAMHRGGRAWRGWFALTGTYGDYLLGTVGQVFPALRDDVL